MVTLRANTSVYHNRTMYRKGEQFIANEQDARMMISKGIADFVPAKKEQVPGHVIEKALDKAKGGGGEDENGKEGDQ